MDYEKLLNMAAELGYQLMYSGAEIYRVEESARRLLQAYGVEAPEVFAIPNCLIVSVATPEGQPVTRMRRVPAHGTDIELLERCNSLCRRLCAQVPPLDEAQAAVNALPDAIPRYSARLMLLGYGVAPAFFAPLFGGGLRDTGCSFFCGLAVGLCLLYGGKFIGANGFFRTAVCSALAAFLALALVEAGLGESVDVVTIATLMVLVPGVALTNAMREIMAGDTFSALSRTADAILVASAIALGAAAGQALGGFFEEGGMETVCFGYALPCLCAFLACVGFTLMFNIHGYGKLIAGVGGALGWLVYLLGGKTIFAAFLAAAAIGVFAEVMSRVRRCPVTGYVLVALLPLVPGGGIYYAMRHGVAGETDLFLSTLLHTFGMAAALAVGAMLASSVFRAVFPRLRPGPPEK